MLFSLFLTVFLSESNAQKWELESSFGLLHSGVNQRIGLRYQAGKATLKGGTTLHFNDQNTADSRNVVYDRSTHSFGWYNSIGGYAGFAFRIARFHQDRVSVSAEFDLNAFNTGSLHSFEYWEGEIGENELPISQSVILKHKTSYPQIQTSLLLRSTFQISDVLFTFFEAGAGPYFLKQNRDYMLEARTGRPVSIGFSRWTGVLFAPFFRKGLGISLGQINRV